jgi:hypothetical protein
MKESINRRKLILGGAAAGIVGAVGLATYGIHESKKGSEEVSKKESKPELKDAPPAPVHRGAFEAGGIKGRKVHDLFAYYLGIKEQGRIPERLNPDFGTIMYHLWQKKLELVHKKHPNRTNTIQQAEQHFGRHYIDAWRDGTITLQTLPELVRDAGKTLEETRRNFEWEHFHENHRYGHLFGPEEAHIVHQLSKNITPEMLVAYSVTELLPFEGDTDPLLQKMPLDVYELLLAHAGREFLVDLPALNDPLLSAGMFQFTSYALYEDEKEKRGASKLNSLIHDPSNRLPSSVLHLDTAQKQFQAAYLFSLDNLAHLIQRIANDREHGHDKKRLHTLAAHESTLHKGLLQYIAGAHHNPAESMTAFTKWIDKDFHGTYADLCGPRIRNYVRSALVNYEELEKRMPKDA